MPTMSHRVPIAVLALVIAVGATAFWLGRSSAEKADWLTGTGAVIGEPKDPDLVVTVDGWDYAASGDLEWMDEFGTVYTGDTWPECLAPVSMNSPRFGEERTIRFATVRVDVDGLRSRRIVMVDCGATF